MDKTKEMQEYLDGLDAHTFNDYLHEYYPHIPEDYLWWLDNAVSREDVNETVDYATRLIQRKKVKETHKKHLHPYKPILQGLPEGT